MKAFVMTTRQWNDLLPEMKKDYPPSVFLLRSRMKDTLGFTPRNHSTWENERYKEEVHLDFYSEHQRTMFLLKYGDRLGQTD